jgi:hypothetical protein
MYFWFIGFCSFTLFYEILKFLFCSFIGFFGGGPTTYLRVARKMNFIYGGWTRKCCIQTTGPEIPHFRQTCAAVLFDRL